MTNRNSIGIRGGRILDPGRGLDLTGDVLIRDGRIAAVGPALSGAEGPDAAGQPALSQVEGAEHVIDARGLVVCPGFVDLHCHLRDPGFEHKETIQTGTQAAARGGFATVCSMANTEPPVDSRATVEYILRTARAQGAVRVLPIGCITRGRQGKELAEMGDLAEAGVVAFSDDGSPVADAALMRHALEYASALGPALSQVEGPALSASKGLAVIDHCEEPSLSHEGMMHEGWVANRLGLRGIPAAAEEAMVARDIALAELTGAHLHIAHVSTAGSVELIRRAKERGLAVTAEVTPHHLSLTHEAVMVGAPALSLSKGTESPGGIAYDTNARVNPPLRTPADVAACIQGLADGTIDAIATDHAPHAIEDKLCEFDLAAPGISGLETALGLCLSLVHEGKLDLSTVIYKLTAGPVRAFGLERWEPGLGSLSIGAPGDVVVLDPQAEWVVEPERFASKGKHTPLAGRTLKGKVMTTVYGGKVVFAEAGVEAAHGR